MSDVIVAAAIAGGVGLLGNVATLIVTRLNSADQAREHKEEARNAARQERQENYARVAWLLGRLEKYEALGFPPLRADWTDWLDQYAYASGIILIVGSASVILGVKAFSEALQTAAPDLRGAVDSNPSMSWTAAYGLHKSDLDAKREDLLERMRRDVVPA